MKKINEVLLRTINFDANTLEEEAVKAVKDELKNQEENTVTWFNIDGLHNTVIIEEIAIGFDLEKLILAEVLNTQAKPRVLEFENCIYLSINMLLENPDTGFISAENLSLILTKSVKSHFRKKEGMCLNL